MTSATVCLKTQSEQHYPPSQCSIICIFHSEGRCSLDGLAKFLGKEFCGWFHGGIESHEKYNRSSNTTSCLQKLQETTQKNTKNLSYNVRELLLWHPCLSAAARAPVQDGVPAHDHAPALAHRLVCAPPPAPASAIQPPRSHAPSVAC
jgi:hypothetical protein